MAEVKDAQVRESLTTQRRIVALVTVLVAITIIAICASTGWRILQQWSSFQQCKTFSLPPNRVIYEDGAIAASALMQDARYTSGSTLFGRASALLRIPQFATYVNEPRTPPVVFLHELISPKGNQRLVAIQFSTIKNDQSGTIIFYPYEEAPAGVPRSKCMGLELIRMPRESLTLFAGQVDSTDASHFTIDYVLNNARETVDGWLFDDDTIRLMPRCGDVLYMPDRGIWTPGNGIGPNWIYRMGQTSLGHTNAAPTSRPSATVPDPIAALNARMQGTTKKPSTAQATPSAQ